MEFSTEQINSNTGSESFEFGFTQNQRDFNGSNKEGVDASNRSAGTYSNNSNVQEFNKWELKELSNAIDLRRVSDKCLISKTMTLVQAERELLISLLHHLREIDRRRLYSALEYKSLHDFTVRHLGYPDDQAYRRINAMKLLRELPELEEKISGGAISLTHIGQAQVLFNSEKKHAQEEFTRDQKLDVFNQISNKSVRESERITLSLSSNPKEMKPDRIKAITCEKSEFKFMASTSTREKVEKLKGLLAHKNPNITLGELFEKLCDLGLEQWDPSRRTAAPRKSRAMNKTTEKFKIEADGKARTSEESENENAPAVKTAAPRKSRAMSKSTVKIKTEADVKARTSEESENENAPAVKTAAPRKSTVQRTSGVESERKADSDCTALKDSAAVKEFAGEGVPRSDEKVAAPRKFSGADRRDDKRLEEKVGRPPTIDALPENGGIHPTSPAKKISAAQVRREVFARARNACENCGSTFALEVDHIQPRALGGADTLENFRLLCRSCNQRAAVQVFGVDKMEAFLR